MAPDAVALIFNEAVSPLVLRLISADGASIDLQNVQTHGPAVIARLPSIGGGTHAISWRVVSADGHPVGGSIVFSIGAPSPSGVAIEIGTPASVRASFGSCAGRSTSAFSWASAAASLRPGLAKASRWWDGPNGRSTSLSQSYSRYCRRAWTSGPRRLWRRPPPSRGPGSLAHGNRYNLCPHALQSGCCDGARSCLNPHSQPQRQARGHAWRSRCRSASRSP